MRSLVALAVLVLLPALAAAEPTPTAVCVDHIDDPVALPWRESGVDAARGACLHSDLAVRLDGHALIDTPGFYGTLGGATTIAARFVEDDRLEWGVALRLADYTFVQNAVLTTTGFGYGPFTAHVAVAGDHRLAGQPTRVAALLRIELPYTRSQLDSSSGALQLGLVTTTRLGPRLRVHGRAAGLGWYASSTSGRTGRLAGALSLDVGWRAVAWLGLFAGVDAQVGWYGLGLDHLAARGGGHWRVKGLWRAELAAGRPLVGAERTDVALALSVRRDLD